MKEIELKAYTRNDSKIAKENFALGWERGCLEPNLETQSYPSDLHNPRKSRNLIEAVDYELKRSQIFKETFYLDKINLISSKFFSFFLNLQMEKILLVLFELIIPGLNKSKGGGISYHKYFKLDRFMCNNIKLDSYKT